jgi:hypothetical protein
MSFRRTIALVFALALVGFYVKLRFSVQTAKAQLAIQKKAADQARFESEFQQLKPIFEAFGVGNAWVQFHSGHCAEATLDMDQNRSTYIQNSKRAGREVPEESMRKIAEMGQRICAESRALPRE